MKNSLENRNTLKNKAIAAGTALAVGGLALVAGSFSNRKPDEIEAQKLSAAAEVTTTVAAEATTTELTTQPTETTITVKAAPNRVTTSTVKPSAIEKAPEYKAVYAKDFVNKDVKVATFQVTLGNGINKRVSETNEIANTRAVEVQYAILKDGRFYYTDDTVGDDRSELNHVTITPETAKSITWNDPETFETLNYAEHSGKLRTEDRKIASYDGSFFRDQSGTEIGAAVATEE